MNNDSRGRWRYAGRFFLIWKTTKGSELEIVLLLAHAQVVATCRHARLLLFPGLEDDKRFGCLPELEKVLELA